MSHAHAPLTPAGRLRLVLRCEDRPIAHVAAEAGISRQCLSKWIQDPRAIDGGELKAARPPTGHTALGATCG
jgi:hypothetical protein